MEVARKVDLLNRVLHATVNSVVQYIENAAPHVPAGFEEHFERLRAMRDEEVGTARALTDLIATLDGVPRVGVFPYWNVDLNYLDLRFLARFAAQHQERIVAEIEDDLDRVRDDPRVHGLLERTLAQKREHLAILRGIGEPGPAGDPAAATDDG